MSFRPDAADLCLRGIKRETRRVLKPGWRIETHAGFFAQWTAIIDDKGRTVWKTGELSTIKRGRTGRGVGKVLIQHLRLEKVQRISPNSAVLEAVEPPTVRGFERTWRRINKLKGKRWEDNPVVVVIRLRPVEVT